MVYIRMISKEPVIAECHKHTGDGEQFRLVIVPVSKEIIEKPDHCDIDVSVAYSRNYGILTRNEKLPEYTTAEWG